MKKFSSVLVLFLAVLFSGNASAQTDSARSGWGDKVLTVTGSKDLYQLTIKSGDIPAAGEKIKLSRLFLSCGIGHDHIADAVVTESKDSIVTFHIEKFHTGETAQAIEGLLVMDWSGKKAGHIESKIDLYDYFIKKEIENRD
ncbi:MAG: hypothetical protein FD123_1499 [Bacteroidetes bacterium]|nr:MAG: hypothetical protein FD123_1499 [Bacteroidota bacterium]